MEWRNAVVVFGIGLLCIPSVLPLGFWGAPVYLAGFFVAMFGPSLPFLPFNRSVPLLDPEFDALANRMGVESRLPKNKKKRYYKVRRKTIAGSTFSSAVAFGADVYDRLSENQRLAVVAHEFVHIRRHDSRRKLLLYDVPAIGLWLSIYAAGAVFVGIPLLNVLLFFGGFYLITPYAALLLMVIDAKNYRRIETRCDAEAVAYVNPEDLISALRSARAVIDTKPKGWFVNLVDSLYPTPEEREKSILRASSSPGLT